MDPKDLINLTRVNTVVRDTLLASNAVTIWRNSRLRHEAPEPAPGFSEPRWAKFLFGGAFCQVSTTSLPVSPCVTPLLSLVVPLVFVVQTSNSCDSCVRVACEKGQAVLLRCATVTHQLSFSVISGSKAFKSLPSLDKSVLDLVPFTTGTG